MAASRSSKKTEPSKQGSSLMVRLDEESKRALSEAAELRQISVSDYVRTVTVAQARREVHAARQRVVALTPAEQLLFWNALNEAPTLTPAQRRLSSLIRGEQ